MSDDSPTEGLGSMVDRRGFLKSVAAAPAAGGLASVLSERTIAQPIEALDPAEESVFDADASADPDAAFPQSVASGGPTDSGVILWTRIAPDTYEDATDLGVEVATDESFSEVVVRGIVPAGEISPSGDYTVKVDLDGNLDSNHQYYYRFTYDGTRSSVGRARTLPGPDESPDSVSFAVLTCQDYQNGYYPAHRYVADEEVDFVIHLGDYIYESAEGAYTGPGSDVREGRDVELPSGADLAETLEDFRHLYKTYRSDRFLQDNHENHTFIAGWDDHEIGNNRYWDYAADAPVLPDKPGGGDPEFAIQLTADGIQAWVEYMPMRVEYDPQEEDLQEQFRLWRSFDFGDLVRLVFTDERLYRDGPPCEDKRITCTREEAEGRTMLGDEQKAWWKDQVASSDANWTTWANEVLTMPLTAGDGWNQIEFIQDSWDGFQYERWELMQFLKDEDPDNFVALTGDLHASLAGYMKEGYGEIDWQWDYDRVGVELMTPAVTSVNAADVIDFPGSWDEDALEWITKDQNEHMQYVNWYQQGYSVVEFTPEETRYTVYGVDKEVDSADADREVLADYRVPEGEIELEER
jgi:alkaline phosphatase D